MEADEGISLARLALAPRRSKSSRVGSAFSVSLHLRRCDRGESINKYQAQAKHGECNSPHNLTNQEKSADTPLFNASHVNGFIVGVMTGAIASLGIVAGINPTALPAAITPSTAGTASRHHNPASPSLTRWKTSPSA